MPWVRKMGLYIVMRVNVVWGCAVVGPVAVADIDDTDDDQTEQYVRYKRAVDIDLVVCGGLVIGLVVGLCDCLGNG